MLYRWEIPKPEEGLELTLFCGAVGTVIGKVPSLKPLHPIFKFPALIPISVPLSGHVPFCGFSFLGFN